MTHACSFSAKPIQFVTASHHSSMSSNPVNYGACQKRQANGDVDGCGQYEESSENKNCEACGCHRSFHVARERSEAVPDSTYGTLPMLANVSSSQPQIHVSTPRSTTSLVSESTSTSSHDKVDIKSQQHPSTFPEYPDGDLTIEIPAHMHDDYGHTGWATMAVSYWKLKGVTSGSARKLKCLGALVCPVPTCSFVARPGRDPSRLLSQVAQLKCVTHKGSIVHQRCSATLTWKDVRSSHGHIHILLHSSNHHHPKPPPIRPPPSAYHRLEQQIM